MKKKNVTRKTVRKRHRLARELEAANEVQVRWGMFRLWGKQYFYFEPVRNNRPGNVYWDGCGGHTIGEALADFYHCLYYVLRYDGRQYYRPARPGFNIRTAFSGLHGRRVVIEL